MGSIKEKIEALSKVNLEDFDSDILEVVESLRFKINKMI